jgi:alkyl hydroperoxide reductase subunit AhpF
MSILNERTRAQVQEAFAALQGPVTLRFFEQSLNCPTCPVARRAAEEIASLSEKITLHILNPMIDRERAAADRIEGVPALAVCGEKDHGIRFYGAPSGYEVGALVEAILDVSLGRVALKTETIEGLRGLTSPVHLQVFVTPT